jgi:hypothetical protein
MQDDNSTPLDTSNMYFAAKPPEMTAGILLTKASSFYNTLQSNAYLDKLKKMWQAYNGVYGGGNDHQIDFTGEEGELVQLPVNHFRNLAQHMFVMITSNRPIMEARAINTDYKSLAQTYLANGILDYYMREKHLEDALKKAAEMAIVLGAGFVKLEWNSTSGEAYDADPETGEMQYEGELEFTNLSPFDVVFDGTKESWNQDWILTRSFQNRYDVAAKYPELKKKILAMPTKGKASIYSLALFTNDDTDDIPVYEFYHKKTEAMPNGRYMLFVDADVVLLDSPLPYRTIPIFRISPSDIMGTPYGYSPMFDIFPIQEGINSLYSAIMTNQNSFAVQNLFVQRGADLNVNTLEGGMNIIEGNSKPEPLQLTQTPKEVFDFLEMLIQSAETISGVNSVARGNPEASLKSGNALALVQSMALQFISGLQQSYVMMVEDVGTSLISILKDYATTPKVIALVGKNNRPLLKEFTGEAISSINRVVVDVGNPLSRTIAGRVQMAEQLLQMKLLDNPRQYFQILNTGRLDSAFEGEMDELMLIKRENERLLEGQPTQVSPLDQHSDHIMEHRAVMADPDLRTDPNLIKNVMDHIQEHLDALRNTDPDLLQMVGQKPLPPIQPPMDPNQPPPAPGGPPGSPPPPGGAPPPFPSMMPKDKAPPQNNAPNLVLQPPQGAPQAGDHIQNTSGGNNSVPNLPHPPPPFQHLPVTTLPQTKNLHRK